MTDSGPPFRRYLRFLRPDLRADIRDEMDFHLDMRARDFELRGHDAPSAREAAERAFGDIGAIGDAVYVIDQRRFKRASRKEAFMSFVQDLRLAARSLVRSPALSVVAVLCLALPLSLYVVLQPPSDRVVRYPLEVVPDRVGRLEVVHGKATATATAAHTGKTPNKRR